MSDNLSARLEALKELNAQIRHQAEQAEARVATANPLIAQLAASGLVADQILLGQFLLLRGYTRGFHPRTPGRSSKLHWRCQGVLELSSGTARSWHRFGTVPSRVRGILAIRAF